MTGDTPTTQPAPAPTTSGPEPIDLAKSKLTVAKSQHTRQCNRIHKLISADEEMDFILSELSILEIRLDDLKNCFSTWLALSKSSDDTGLDPNMDNHDKVKDELQKFKKTKKSSLQSTKENDTAQKTLSTPMAVATPKLRVPDMTPFDNNIRTYAAFKTKFITHYEKHYGEHAVLVLKENLLLNYPKRMCAAATSVTEVFELLDQSFGDAGKLTEVILDDLEMLPKCRDNVLADLKKVRDTVNLARVDMKSVGLSSHIEQFQTVTLLKRKLSAASQRRWAEKVASNNISTEKRFTSLVDFINLEIRTLELMPNNDAGVSNFQNDVAPSSGAVRAVRGSTEVDQIREQVLVCPIHGTAPHFLYQCRLFKRMSTNEKVEVLQNQAKRLCRSCLKFEHRTCTMDLPPCNTADGECKKRHRSVMHDACAILSRTDRSAHTYHSHAGTPKPGHLQLQTEFSISPAQRIRVPRSNVMFDQLNTLWDSGSNLTLVLNSTCDKCQFRKLEENPTNLTIDTVGNNPITQLAQRYIIPLLDHNNETTCTVIAYGVDKIGTLEDIDISAARSIFGIPLHEQSGIEYPSGEIQLLLGSDNAHLILHHISEVDGLRLSESILGKVVWGRHPSFKCKASSRAVMVRLAPPKPQRLSKDFELDSQVKSLFSTDMMGVSCIPQCGRCHCGKCQVDGSSMTLEERFEFNQIMSSITLENGVITASYPYRKDISLLPDNYQLALKRLYQIERKLAKDLNLATQYQAQFDDMTARGKLRLLTSKELEKWTGPVQYLPHNYVLKPSSQSTPCRLIFDPSAPFRGHAVNDYWGRGPNLVNDSFGILIRFREYLVAFTADIKKMYHTVMLREPEVHLHRVLWRNLDTTRAPDIYAILCNSFGSGPAGAVAIAALHYLANLKKDIFPRAAETILNQSYVDDLIDSTDNPQLARQIMKDVDVILATGGFAVKQWTLVESMVSSPHRETTQTNESEPSIVSSNNSVLGIFHDTGADEFYFKAQLNFSKKRRGLRLGPNILKDEIFDTSSVPALTKRLILAQVNSIYDPLGLLGPFTVELKFALGKLWRYRTELQTELAWDDPIPPDHDALWRNLLNKFFLIEDLRFPRCLASPKIEGPPILVTFSDSSMMAYGACSYVRWATNDGTTHSALVASKSRMWPIDPADFLSVCRGELQGAVLAKRLAATIIKESRYDLAESLYVIDSEIVLAQINMDGHHFTTFVGNRVAEIRSATRPDQWFKTRSANNPSADLLSRGTTDTNLLRPTTPWQNGPDWLSLPRMQWPLSQDSDTKTPIPELRSVGLDSRVMMAQVTDCPSVDHPAIEGASRQDAQILHTIQKIGEDRHSAKTSDPIPAIRTFSKVERDFIAQHIDLTRRDGMEFWLAVTYRVLHALSWKKTGNDSLFERFFEPVVVSAEQRQAAKLFWIMNAQTLMEAKIRSGHYKTLTPFWDQNGVIRCNGRAGNDTGCYQPILLPSNHPFSRLVVLYFHRRGHSGATATAAKVRAEYHIIQLRNLATSVRNNCQLCKLVEHRLMTAPMGSLPPSRIRPSLPFENSSCDIFGTFHVQLVGKFTRSRKVDPPYTKAYGLILTCLSTRAVHIETMHGQDTTAFLLALRRFSAIRGQPKSMFSDCGGQLVAADNELKSMVDAFDLETVQKYGATNGMKWHYSSPGSPWQNGVSEALIKSVKKTLRTISQPTDKLTILELQTVLYEVANLLNERPIGLGHQGASGRDFDSSTSTYICPNQLLLGRSTSRSPPDLSNSDQISATDRLLAVQRIITDWWSRWTSLYLPSLIYQPKWYKQGRQARRGDIVHVRDLNLIRGDWHIGEIIDIKENTEKIPRDVLIRYKTPGDRPEYRPSPYKTQWRDVKNLVLIVPAEGRSELNPSATEFQPSNQ